MEEIKVGNFIRTPYHTIEKVVKIEKSKNKMYDDMVTTDKSCYGLNWLKRNGTKSSSDLISLVEEGDYVNGCKVRKVFVDVFTKKTRIMIENIEMNWQGDMSDICFESEDIKTIVTKEQYNQMKYIVGDE